LIIDSALRKIAFPGEKWQTARVGIDYTVQTWQEGAQYIAHAMPLDVASSGSTPEGAREAVDEAVRLFLATCAETKTLDQVLEECGYERNGDAEWRSPIWQGVEHHNAVIA